MSRFTIPGGREKGTPLAEASDSTLQYWADNAHDDAMKEACVAELELRGGSDAGPQAQQQKPQTEEPPPGEHRPQPPQQQRKPSRQLATRPSDSVVHAKLATSVEVNRRLMEASKEYHLVSPATSCDIIPEGCAVTLSLVCVDPNPDPYKGPKEVYAVGGRLGLSLSTLQRIASAAALSWDPDKSGRLDDGSDPHYCHYRAVGVVRNFDGSPRTVTGEVEIDARDGSPQIEEIVTKAKNAKDKGGRPRPRDPAPQILELRKFILRHAESKAKNRAVADMGVKRSYAPEELQKPFAVARLMWTGETNDPELKREAFRMRAEAMGGAVHGLYGDEGVAPSGLPAHRAGRPALPRHVGHAPPPVSEVNDDPSDNMRQDIDAENEDE